MPRLKSVSIFVFTLIVLGSTTKPNHVQAEYAYSPSSATVDQGTQLNDFEYSSAADNNYWRIVSTSSGIDATVTFNGVQLSSANNILVHYDGLVSSASLTYQIQIRDFTNSTWRNIIPHDTTYSNTADSAAGLVLANATTGALSGGEFNVYDGFFTNGSNSTTATPLSNFINGSNQVQIRFLYSGSTPYMELRVDYINVEPVIDNRLTPSGFTNTAGGTISNEYNDLTTDDNTTNMVINANASGIDAYYSFTNAPTPYTGANTILVEASAFRTTITNYSISIRDFTNSQWDTLSSVALTATIDGTNYFATSTSQAVTDYISSGEIRVRISSASTSGSVTVDMIRVTIGSVATNSGFYVGTISRGGAATGTVANTATVDTSTTDSVWAIPTTTADTRTTNEHTGDCGTATNSCVAANIQLPVTLPSNVTTTGIYSAFRYNISVATIDIEYGIRTKRWGLFNMTPQSANTDDTTSTMIIRTASYPMDPQTGNDPIVTVPVYQPHEMVNTVDNAVEMYVRTVANTVATAQTLNWDFAFTSIRYIGPERSITNAWSSNNAGTVTTGSNSNSNGRMAQADDNTSWVIAHSANVVDAYMSFTNVAIPTGSNKLLVNVQMSCSAASGTYELYIRDFVGATWRELTHHGGAYTCAVTEAYHQFEVYDGYFSNGTGTPTSTPLSNFVSGNEVRIRVLSTAATANMQIDYGFIEFSKDSTYYPADEVLTNGTLTSNDYNDTLTDDNNTNMVVSNSSGIDYYFSFTNVVTPPSGSNAAYLVFSGFHTGATSYNLFIRNFNSASWTQINGTALTNTSDATNNFIFPISTWSDFISSGEMRIRVATTAAAGSTTVDYVKLVLGSVNTSGAGTTTLLGQDYLGSYTNITNLDTSTTFAQSTHPWRWRTAPNTQNALSTHNPGAGIALAIDLPLTLPTNSSPKQLSYILKAGNSSTSITLTPSFKNTKQYFYDASAVAATPTLTNQIKADFTSGTVPPTALNTVTFAVTSQTTRDGWAIVDVPNLIDTTNNEVKLRFRTSGSTILEGYVDFDVVFVALKYVD